MEIRGHIKDGRKCRDVVWGRNRSQGKCHGCRERREREEGAYRGTKKENIYAKLLSGKKRGVDFCVVLQRRQANNQEADGVETEI